MNLLVSSLVFIDFITQNREQRNSSRNPLPPSQHAVAKAEAAARRAQLEMEEIDVIKWFRWFETMRLLSQKFAKSVDDDVEGVQRS